MIDCERGQVQRQHCKDIDKTDAPVERTAFAQQNDRQAGWKRNQRGPDMDEGEGTLGHFYPSRMSRR